MFRIIGLQNHLGGSATRRVPVCRRRTRSLKHETHDTEKPRAALPGPFRVRTITPVTESHSIKIISLRLYSKSPGRKAPRPLTFH
jgi:hypothetical protein